MPTPNTLFKMGVYSSLNIPNPHTPFLFSQSPENCHIIYSFIRFIVFHLSPPSELLPPRGQGFFFCFNDTPHAVNSALNTGGIQ